MQLTVLLPSTTSPETLPGDLRVVAGDAHGGAVMP